MRNLDLARRRVQLAILCCYAAVFLGALALAALDDDDQADVDACPFDRAPVDEPLDPDAVDRLMARDSAAYRAGWLEHERQRLAGDLPRRR